MSYLSLGCNSSFVFSKKRSNLRSMTNVHRILFFSFFLSFVLSTFSQNKPQSHESMIWIEAIEKVQFNDRLASNFLWHHRIFFDREQTYQDIYWLDISGKVSQNLSLTGGVMYFTYHRFSFDRFLSVPEWRPFQSIAYSRKFGKVKTKFRLMFEQRYTRRVEEGHLQNECNFNMRLRNRVQAFVPIGSQFQVEISEEILLRDINHGKGIFDQSRGRVRLHYYPGGGKFGINAGYLHWLLNTSDDLEHRHSIMVGVRHRIAL